MPKLFLAFLFLVILSYGKEVKVTYLDMERILSEYEMAREAKREIEKEAEKYRLQSDSLRRELEEAKREVESKRLLLSAEGRRTEEEKLKELERRYYNFLSEIWGERGRIAAKNQELLAPIVKKVLEAIEKVAKEEEATIVLDASQQKILYAQPGLDLTDAVLTELRREAGVLPLAPEEEKKFALLTISEGNVEAREENLGDICLTYLYQLLEGRRKVKTIEREEVKRVLSYRNLKEGDVVEKSIIYELGKELVADYVLIGTVNKSGKRITVEITYFDVDLRKEFPAQKVEVTRREELKAKIGDVIKKILKATIGE